MGMAYYMIMMITVIIGVFSMGMTLGLIMSHVAHNTIIA